MRNTHLRGVGCNLTVKGEGTLAWKRNDEHGTIHELTIKNALYVPLSRSCLLSPQYWTQQAQDNISKLRELWCAIYGDDYTIHWG